MTHEELLDKMPLGYWYSQNELNGLLRAIRAVVELHKPEQINPTYLVCTNCYDEESGPSDYPCDTIQAIEKELG